MARRSDIRGWLHLPLGLREHVTMNSWTIRVCPKCGRDDRTTPFTGKKHWTGGERCDGKPEPVTVYSQDLLTDLAEQLEARADRTPSDGAFAQGRERGLVEAAQLLRSHTERRRADG